MKKVNASSWKRGKAYHLTSAARALLLAMLVAQPALGADESTTGVRWRQTGVLTAPEANQAAAADEKYVYAITNTKIAKYDRATGKRLAESHGDAHHLNSGFLWQGRLYCAHSNYPKTPEQSQIKVLDLATMVLSTFKDFGNYGGSLTWVVGRDQHWWCNFARYNEDNGQTFLAEFDDAWHETRRWTLPAELVARLGRFSLSGGLWRGDSLLTTDHDHTQLYLLRVPAQGKVLEYVETQASPFPGQGIADDPLTGGLVGIHRGKRQVVFAVAEK